ncbi:prepilin peptidase [Sandaracinobacteroides hominis]|uniref:prepilin peptidase n=1 Tax=Sandaracinobacteroides hominis TaxID=2780086 RepID=UPI0038B45F83
MLPFLWPILGGLFGLVAGSFLATLVLRWPEGRPLSGRSACDSCGATLAPRDLVPLLSWLVLRGRCRRCGASIDTTHPLIELACATAGVLALVALPGPQGFAGALLGSLLVALIALDIRHFWLPDALTLPLLAFGLLLGPSPFPDRLLGAAIGSGALLAIALAFRWLRGREGMGMGDIKLMAALGAWLSPAHLPPLLLLAALIGLGMAGVSRLRGRRLDSATRIPFGACLAAAAFPLWLLIAATSPVWIQGQALETNQQAPYAQHSSE